MVRIKKVLRGSRSSIFCSMPTVVQFWKTPPEILSQNRPIDHFSPPAYRSSGVTLSASPWFDSFKVNLVQSMLNIVKWWVHIVKGSTSILSIEPCLESKLWTSPGREHGSLKISPTRTCVEIELPPSVPFIISLLAFRPLQPSATKSFLHVESRSNWASCIVGPYRFKGLQTVLTKIFCLIYECLLLEILWKSSSRVENKIKQ